MSTKNILRKQPFHVADLNTTTPAKKVKIEKKIVLTQNRDGSHASVRIIVPPSVDILSLNIVKRGIARHTSYIQIGAEENRTDVIPLGCTKDITKEDLLNPATDLIKKSSNVSFLYIFLPIQNYTIIYTYDNHYNNK